MEFNVSASGNTLTITPASSSVKFVTGTSVLSSGNIVSIAGSKIKDANGISSSSATTLAYNSTDIQDLAAPVILSAAVNSATDVVVNYSEEVNFKATSSNAEASQFYVNGVKVNGYAASAAITSAPDDVITLTFGTGTFETGKDYSASTLSYTKNTNYLVKDNDDNQAASVTFKGLIKGSF